MTLVGKIFKKIPYFVRDSNNEYKNIKYIETIITNLIKDNQVSKESIICIFSNNRDNILHFHLILKEENKNQNIFLLSNNEEIEITFDTLKIKNAKSKKINSLTFIEIFKHINENALSSIFDDMIACDGKDLFLATNKENLNLFDPKSKYYVYRKILWEKKDLISDISENLHIDSNRLFEELNPNIIKQVCKDLKLTYKSLSVELGYKPDTINKAASTGKVSEQLKKAIDLYLENQRLKEELKNIDKINHSFKHIGF